MSLYHIIFISSDQNQKTYAFTVSETYSVSFHFSFQNDTSSSNEQIHGDQSGILSSQGSTEGAHCETVTVRLHAFIQPTLWGRNEDNLRIEVRSDLNWNKTCAKVHFSK